MSFFANNFKLKNTQLHYLFLFLVFNIFFISCTSSLQNSKTKESKNTVQAKSTILAETAKGANTLRISTINKANGYRIFGDFLVDEPIELDQVFGKYSVSYIQDKYVDLNKKKETKSVTLHPGNTQITNNRLVSFFFDMPALPKDYIISTISLEIKERGNLSKMLAETELKKGSLRTSDKLGIYLNNSDFLVNQNFAHAIDTLRIDNEVDSLKQYTVIRYKHDFAPALPPTAMGYKTTAKALYVDSLFKIAVNQPFVLKNEGLYYIAKDTIDQSGLTILINNDRFPRYTKAEELTKPLIYLSTNKEYLEMVENKNSKEALDLFWLQLFGNNKQTASKAIKNLYKKVADANTQFTTYKEGWKTDKGMVYIVMGKPDQVKFLKEKEVWVYTKNAKYSEVNFTFVKKSNKFSDEHFELNRYIEFKPIWLPAVEALRNIDKN